MWRLESGRGCWHTQQFQFQVDLKRPDLGWAGIRLGDASFADSIFQVELPGQGGVQALVDSYVRQADLIATYSQSPDRTVRPQVIWRVIRDGEARVGVEMILSMQTSLLASQPAVRIHHTLSGDLIVLQESGETAAGAEPRDYSEPLVLLQRPGGESQWSLAVMVHPADFLSLRLQPAGATCHATFQLFPESLEKGVIRRARMQGVYVDRSNDVALAQKCFQELAAASPPLTT